MKRLILPLSLLLTLLATAPLFAVDDSQRPTLVQDVIRMTQGGVSDQAIVAFIQNRRGTYTVTADDMIAMSDAKVSKDVMAFVANSAATSEPATQTNPATQPNDQNWRNRRSTERDDVEETREARTVVVPRVYVSPWWWDPWYYYDPFWYGPRLSLNLGFGYYWGGYRGPYWGGRYYGGGHYYGGGGHYGGGHFGGGQPRPGGGGGIIRRGR